MSYVSQNVKVKLAHSHNQFDFIQVKMAVYDSDLRFCVLLQSSREAAGFYANCKACVCVSVCVRERERVNRRSEFTSQAQVFVFSFFVFEWGRREGSVPRQPVRQAIAGASL